MNGTCFNVKHITGPFVMQLFCAAGIVTLRHVVDLCAPNLINTAGLASHVGVRSIRIINQILSTWKCELTKTELSLLKDYCNGQCQLAVDDVDDSFPALTVRVQRDSLK